MKNKLYTKVYKLLDSGMKVRKIKQTIKERYDVSIRESDIIKWFPIKRNHNQYSDYKKHLMIYLYVNCSNPNKLITYLKDRHGIETTLTALRCLASKSGIQRRKLHEDTILKNFSLKNIDSPEKAYFLGLMMTDGAIHPKNNSMRLLLSDEDAISFLAHYIGIDYKVRVYPVSTVRKAHKKPTYRIELNSKRLVKELEYYGVTPNKSLTLCPTFNPEEMPYLNYLLRGIIDGDGSIRADGSRVSIYSASSLFAEWCVSAFEYIGFNPPKIQIRYEYDDSQSTMYIVDTGSKHNMDKLRHIVYGHPFGMMRKYNRLVKKDVQRL